MGGWRDMGLTLTAAAGAVLLALVAAAGVLVANQGQHARALIEQGDEDVPIAAVRRQRDACWTTMGELIWRAFSTASPGRARSRGRQPGSAALPPPDDRGHGCRPRDVSDVLRKRPQSARGVAAAQPGDRRRVAAARVRRTGAPDRVASHPIRGPQLSVPKRPAPDDRVARHRRSISEEDWRMMPAVSVSAISRMWLRIAS
jgi:hypothetical protein